MQEQGRVRYYNNFTEEARINQRKQVPQPLNETLLTYKHVECCCTSALLSMITDVGSERRGEELRRAGERERSSSEALFDSSL